MKISIFNTLTSFGIAILMSSCSASSHAQYRAGVGSTIGALTGGILGHQSGRSIEGAAVGAATGAVIGHVSGTEKDQKINRQYQSITQPSRSIPGWDSHSRYK